MNYEHQQEPCHQLWQWLEDGVVNGYLEYDMYQLWQWLEDGVVNGYLEYDMYQLWQWLEDGVVNRCMMCMLGDRSKLINVNIFNITSGTLCLCDM